MTASIAISGWLDFEDRATRDSLVDATIELQAATRRDEPGCLAYVFGADPAEPNRLHIFELWTDEAALAAHFLHPNYLAMRTILRRYSRVGGSTVKHRVTLTEPVYDTSHAPRADFFTPQETL